MPLCLSASEIDKDQHESMSKMGIWNLEREKQKDTNR